MADNTLEHLTSLVSTADNGVNDVLDAILMEGRVVRNFSDLIDQQNGGPQTDRGRDIVGAFLELVKKSAGDTDLEEFVQKEIVDKGGVQLFIQRRVTEIDEGVSKQLNEILHHPDVQKLEASWRGLHYFVFNTETGPMLKLRLLNASKGELLDDMEKAVDFDQSHLFKAVYEEEYGTFGGSPYGLLLGDYEIERHPDDFAFVDKISQVAAAAHAPFLAAASPSLFDRDSFTELGVPRDLSKVMEADEMAPWRSFRNGEDSRYVSLVLPRFLLRLPYGQKTKPVKEFGYEENVSGPDHDKYLWGNAAYALATKITGAFARYHWCTAIRGVEGGGLVEGLPVHVFTTNEGDKVMKSPTEVAITDRREKELSDLGFIALIHCKGENYAAFFSGTTTNHPIEYLTDSATANARLSGQLPFILAASRFAHYLKAIVRDKIGSFQTAGEVSKFLNTWIAQYILLADDAPQAAKAKFPLREARVDVKDVPGKPGVFTATVFLKPHFQLEELTASIRLVAELPPPAA